MMTDFFIDCKKIESKTISDGLGGYDVVEYVGISFKGLPVKASNTTQLVGAVQGINATSYNFHTFANIPLQKNDKIAYIEKGKTRYIKLTSDVIVNTELSNQTNWVTFTAEEYVPTKIIEE